MKNKLLSVFPGHLAQDCFKSDDVEKKYELIPEMDEYMKSLSQEGGAHASSHSHKKKKKVYIPPTNFVCDGYTVFMLSVRAYLHHLLPQLLKGQYDMLPIQYRHIEHMYEGVWFGKNNF